MTQQVKTLCSYLHNRHKLCKNDIKLSYLKAFFKQKILFYKKIKTVRVKCSIHCHSIHI